MTKEFIPYEEALALKELGFDKPCLAFWDGKNTEAFYFNNIRDASGDYIPFQKHDRLKWFGAPLYQQAFRWFREKHNLYSEITLDSYKAPYSLKVTIKHLDDTNTFVDKEYYPYSNGIGDIDNKKYEEAELECLKQLIKIVKEEP